MRVGRIADLVDRFNSSVYGGVETDGEVGACDIFIYGAR